MILPIKAYLRKKQFLAPTLDCVEQINDNVLPLIKGDEKQYLSSDTPCKYDVFPLIKGDENNI
jgi:hypothetical protein